MGTPPPKMGWPAHWWMPGDGSTYLVGALYPSDEEDSWWVQLAPSEDPPIFEGGSVALAHSNDLLPSVSPFCSTAVDFVVLHGRLRRMVNTGSEWLSAHLSHRWALIRAAFLSSRWYKGMEGLKSPDPTGDSHLSLWLELAEGWLCRNLTPERGPHLRFVLASPPTFRRYPEVEVDDIYWLSRLACCLSIAEGGLRALLAYWRLQ